MPRRLSTSADRLQRGDFVGLCYRLGHDNVTGVLSLELRGGQSELLILRRGHLFTRDQDNRCRGTELRMERLAHAGTLVHFDEGLAAYPPAVGRPFSLTKWARRHYEAQLDSARAQDLVRELAGVRLSCNRERLPKVSELDMTDLRILDTLETPRRLDQIWPLAHAPRFRLLCFIHFLRSVGAIEECGVAAHAPIHKDVRRAKAIQMLGLTDDATALDIKKAYYQLARQLHPDLNRGGTQTHRLAQINTAYRTLTQASQR